MSVKIIRCVTCGAPTKRLEKNCQYCGNFLIHLTPFELLSNSVAPNQPFFRSLKILYKASLIMGLVACFLIYIVFFNFLSETELVLISPVWFLLLHFGISGLYTERAIGAIINRKATDFHEGLQQATSDSGPLIALVVKITFLPLLLLFGFKKVTSPLILALLTTLIWGLLLNFFFVGIFPQL